MDEEHDYSMEWEELVEGCEQSLQEACPLQEDEVIIWAARKIIDLELTLDIYRG